MTDNEQTQPQSTPKERSSSYPAINLEQAILNVGKLKNNLGKGQFSRESAARALGYKGLSGKSTVVVAALIQFGLLDRHAGVYSVSSLADSILTYRDDAERQAGIIQAAKLPSLYASLIVAYEGHSLPAMLEHILARDYGIREKVAGNVVKTFTESLTYAGLLEHGVITSQSPKTDSTSDKTPENGSDHGPDRSAPDSAPERSTAQPDSATRVSVPITEEVWLSYPANTKLAFELMTNDEISKALKTLKKAIGKSGAQSGENGNEPE